MGFRTSFILMIFCLGAKPAFSDSITFIEEPLAESSPIVVAIDHDNVAPVVEWLRVGHSPLAKIKNKISEKLLERAASHASVHSFEVLFTAVHAAHEDGNLQDSRGTPLLLTLSELAVPGKTSTALFEQMISLMLTVTPSMALVKDHAYIGDGRTALHQAAAIGNANVAEMLIARGAGVNEKNSSGETPLHFAARFGHVELATLLLKWGAQINVKSKFTQTTPLMAAAEMGHENIIRMLMLSGAEREARDAFGKTAPERFREYGVAFSTSVPRKIEN